MSHLHGLRPARRLAASLVVLTILFGSAATLRARSTDAVPVAASQPAPTPMRRLVTCEVPTSVQEARSQFPGVQAAVVGTVNSVRPGKGADTVIELSGVRRVWGRTAPAVKEVHLAARGWTGKGQYLFLVDAAGSTDPVYFVTGGRLGILRPLPGGSWRPTCQGLRSTGTATSTTLRSLPDLSALLTRAHQQ